MQFQGLPRLSPRQAKVLVCVSAALIAAVDFSLPANIDIASFYFLSIVLAGWTRSAKWFWISTVVFIGLTFGGLILAPVPILNTVTWIDWLNRGMTAVALAVVAIPVHLKLHNVTALERSIAEKERAERALQENHALLEKRVEERTQELRELSFKLLRAQDDERRHFARELHDGLGQCLAALKLSLNFVERSIPQSDESGRRHFAEFCQLTDDAISQVRTLSHLMYPPLLEQVGLESAIPWYVQGFEQRSGVHTKLEMPERLPRFGREVELTIFRILQESLTNIHRHSGSRDAVVRITVANPAIILEVQDNGKGIEGITKGVGLRGMEERVRQLMGKFEISSGPQGTLITATLPYSQLMSAAH